VTDELRIQATPAARAALVAVRAREGGQVMFVQSGGCCAGSVPMCFLDGEYLTGDGDILLGDVDGAPFYIEETLERALGHPSFVLDVAPGGPRASRWAPAREATSSPARRPASYRTRLTRRSHPAREGPLRHALTHGMANRVRAGTACFGNSYHAGASPVSCQISGLW